jgi:NTE family protein
MVNDKDRNPLWKGHKPPGMLKIFVQCITIMENEINTLRLERNGADLLIRPELSGITLLEFHKADHAIRAGEQASLNNLQKIYSLYAN